MTREQTVFDENQWISFGCGIKAGERIDVDWLANGFGTQVYSLA